MKSLYIYQDFSTPSAAAGTRFYEFPKALLKLSIDTLLKKCAEMRARSVLLAADFI